MSKLEPGHPIGYMFRRETQNLSKYPSLWTPVVDQKLLSTRNFFRKNLYSHFGCVNAIEFSNDGSYLVSGGDDRRILVWNVSAALKSKAKPIMIMQAEHGSNVFALAIDSLNTKIFSAGNDDQVIVHDVTTGAPLDYFVHEQPVYGVSIDPLNDNIFASACDDGRLLVYDIRESSADPFCLASCSSAFHAVQFHPTEPRLIVSGNSKEGVALWDVRKPKTPLLRYGGLNADQCCMSARFNSDGSQILALRRRLPPILYSTDNTAHLFQFNHAGYYNSCTMKSCSFAGKNDEFVLSGSDNFDLYMYKIPPPGSDRWVDKAHVILKGHRSIVNQVRYNKAHSVIMSSGVEKLIKVWSPFSMLSGSKSTGPNEAMFTMNERERRIYSHTEYINLVTQSGQFMSLTFDTTRKTTKEDPRMMAFFDALVLRDLEGWSEDSDNIAESSYAVVSQESSSDDSEDVLSQSIFNTSTETTTTTTTEATLNTSNGSQQSLQQLPESEDSESDSVIIPISSFEDGVSHLSSRTNLDSSANTSSSNGTSSNNNQRTLPRLDLYIDHSNNNSTDDDDDDDNDDTFKNFIENLPQNTTKHGNIIKELISKKNDKLHQLAKAHVVLESTIKKPGKKGVRRNYRGHQNTDTSSDKQQGKENGDPSKKKCKRKLNKKSSSFNDSSSADDSDDDSENSKNGNDPSLSPQHRQKVRKLDSGQSSSSGSKSDSSSNSGNSKSINTNRRHRGRRRHQRSSKPSTTATSPSSSRRLNKRKMFESFKNLRYEKENSNGSTANSESGPFCSFYCQSQGRYTHKRTSSSSEKSSENADTTNTKEKHGITCSKNKKTDDTSKGKDDDDACTSSSVKVQETKNKTSKRKLKTGTNKADSPSSSSSSSSSSSTSSNSSSTSPSGSDSSSPTHYRRAKLKLKPTSSSSLPSASKKLVSYPSTNDDDDNSSSSSSSSSSNDESELSKIQSQIDSIKNSPAFKLSPLRRIEKERLRKLIQEKERIKDKNKSHDTHKFTPVENEQLDECESNSTSINIRKRTWFDNKSSTHKESPPHPSFTTVSCSATSSESSSKEENKDYTFLSKPSKKRLKYLNPNYKNYSSNGLTPQSPDSELLLLYEKEEPTHKSDNNNTTTTTTTTTTPDTTKETVNNNDKTTLHSSLVEILEHDFENQNQNNTDLDLHTISHNFFDEELNNNHNNNDESPTITTTTTNFTVPTEVSEENSCDFNINDDDQDLHFTHLS